VRTRLFVVRRAARVLRAPHAPQEQAPSQREPRARAIFARASVQAAQARGARIECAPTAKSMMCVRKPAPKSHFELLLLTLF